MNPNPSVSVIVVNRNRARLLQKCLSSLVAQSCPPHEVLVVDNGSTDESRQVVASFAPQGVRCLPQSRNLGFAAANNLGIQISSGELVALINNDAIAEPHWLEQLAQAMLSSADVGMCASRILLVGGSIIDKAGHLMFPDGQNRGRGSGQLDLGQYNRLEESLFPDGCAALYRKTLLTEVSGFDEDFFAYGDDADLGIRARWKGWRCLYVPTAVVFHRQSSTSGLYSTQKVYWVERNRLWLAVKSFPVSLLLLSPFLTLYRWFWNFLAAALGKGAAGNFRSEVGWLQLFRTLGRAYWDGISRLGSMWRKRRQIRRGRRISVWQFCLLLRRFRISARVLAFEDAPQRARLSEADTLGQAALKQARIQLPS